MKIASLSIFSLLFLLACGSGENKSNQIAERENEKKFGLSEKKADADFAVQATTAGMMEVLLGNLALKNGTSPEVKEFGKSMAVEHARSKEELKSIAAGKGIVLPLEPDAEQQQKMDSLQQRSGAGFDRAYIDMMVAEHKAALGFFAKEISYGSDPQLKGWAERNLSGLYHHLQMAEDIRAKLGR